MAVVTVKSTPITNLDASPRVVNQAGAGAKYRSDNIDAFAAIANGDSIGSKYIMFRIDSKAVVKDLELETPAIATAIADIGLYHASSAADCSPGIVAGAVIDADFFASAQALTAALSLTKVVNESGFYPVANRAKQIWEAAGLATDPGGKFDVVLTLTAAATAAGNVYLKGEVIEV